MVPSGGVSTVGDPVRFVQEHLRGRIDTFAAGAPPEGVLRLDLNEGAYGPTAAARRAMEAAMPSLQRYPDATAEALRDRLAAVHDLAPDQILVGPGSNSLMALLVRLCAGRGSGVAYSWPGFPSYAMAAARVGATAVPVATHADGRDDLAALVEVAPRVALLFLATPANPTGRRVEDGLAEFAAAVSEDTLLVVDEAYHEYHRADVSAVDLVRDGAPIVALRTFSKIFGLAGARIGWAALPAPLARHARALQETFEVGTLPQAAALASLEDPEEIGRRAAANARVRAALETWFAERGVEHWSSTTNFVAIRPSDPALVVERAAERGVLVRRLTAFGDPTRVRIGVPAEADLPRALAALEWALP